MTDLAHPGSNPSTMEHHGPDIGTRVACLQRLATAMSGYCDLEVRVRLDGPAPCLAARNTTATGLSETVAVTEFGGSLAFAWSWGERIAEASDPDSAARAIAYVLGARDAQLGR